ncbi:MAG TPA: hypothetical protein PLW10_20970 [Myxococcota bacterium]|nr:hypothetical protein [Myxococcota bacterium]
MRVVFVSLLLFFLLVGVAQAGPASVGSELRVVRHPGYESWVRLRAELAYREARTELLRAQTLAYEVRAASEALRAESTLSAREPEGERTLGRACIYGRAGEILYRPAGKACRESDPGQ